MHWCLYYRESQKKREKGSEKIFEDIKAENFTNLRKETVTHVQEAQKVPYRMIPKRNTPRHVVIKMTKIKDKENIKCSKRKTTNNPQGNCWFFSRLYRPKGSGTIYLKWWKGKTYNQKYSIQQVSCSDLWRNHKIYRQAKADRIQHHETRFMTNVKETPLGKKKKAI